MTVKVSKPAINVREELADLKKPTGIAGQAMLAAETPQEQFNLIGAGRRRMNINGALQVWQRGTSFSHGSANYTADRWKIHPGSNPGVLASTRQQFSATDDMLLVNGFNYYLKTEYTTGTGAGAYDNKHFRINQENAYFYAGKTFSISFWAKSDSNRKLGLQTRLNAGVSEDTTYKSVLDDTGWQLSTTWQYFKHTFSIPSLNTTTAAIDDSRAEFYITVDPNDTGAIYEITGLQIELGKVATPFEHRSYGEELALCQRYFTQFNVLSAGERILIGAVESSTRSRHDMPIAAPMRATPTITTNGSLLVYEGGSSKGFSNPQITAVTNSLMGLKVDISSGNTANACMIRFNSTSDYIRLDAEL